MVWYEWGMGEPLVLLHGGSGSWTHWIQNIPMLEKHFRVICADTPGLGNSDMPPGIFSSNDYPASMRMLADIFAIGIDQVIGEGMRFHLVGFSMGAIAGGYLAATEKNRIMTFTMVGASSFGLSWEGLQGRLQIMTSGMSDAERQKIQQSNLRVIMTFHEADDFSAYLQLKNVERARIRSHTLPYTDTLMRILPKITVPLGGIWGGKDVFAESNLNKFEDILRRVDPSASFQVIADAGHWVMYEQAEAFNAALLYAIGSRL